MNVTIVLTLIFIFTSNVIAGGNKGYFEIETVKKGSDFAFPIIRHGATQRARRKINQLLQLSELQGLVGGSTRNIFAQTSVDDGSIYGGKNGINPTVYSNNRRILSVGFDESSCGMTCTYWHRYYNFNSGNGDRMELRDLFTLEGFAQFQKMVVEKRSSIYRGEVRKKVQREDQEGFLDSLACFENDDLTDFYLRNGTIVIDGENCLIKSQKFDGLNMYARFRLPEFRSHLNQYGRIVFGLTDNSVAGFRSGSLPQLFEGSIDGSLSIAMVLNREYATQGIRGVYAYLKYGEGIGLQGTLRGNDAEITEFVLSGVTEINVYGPTRRYIENGYISATLHGPLLEGTWTNKDKSRTVPLVATIR